jgi:hypothetical protein
MIPKTGIALNSNACFVLNDLRMIRHMLIVFILLNFCTVRASASTVVQDTLPIDTMRAYIIAHPNGAKSLRLLKGLSFTQDYPTIATLYQLLGASLKRTPAGLKFGYQLEGMKSVVIGQTVPDFTAPDTGGIYLT